jgi:hypothetical protein
MSHPVFLHIMSTGDVWFSIDSTYVPAGTVLAAYRIVSDAHTQKLGTITATSSAITAASGGNSRTGPDKV